MGGSVKRRSVALLGGACVCMTEASVEWALWVQNGPSGDLCRFLHLSSRFGLHVNVIGWEPSVNRCDDKRGPPYHHVKSNKQYDHILSRVISRASKERMAARSYSGAGVFFTHWTGGGRSSTWGPRW